MRKNEEMIAIYSRKSKFTGKGESIGNQVELCKEYIRVHYGDAAVDRVVVYEDIFCRINPRRKGRRRTLRQTYQIYAEDVGCAYRACRQPAPQPAGAGQEGHRNL